MEKMPMYTQDLKEEPVRSENVYSGCLLQVYRDEIRLPNGSDSVRELIRHVGAVCVVAMTDENEVIIEKQYRYPFGRVLTELPAGKLDSPDEDPLDAAKRELKEETGYTAEKWKYLGVCYPTVAYSDEVIHLYLARGLTAGDQALDEDEFLHYKKVPLRTLLEDIMNNKIEDGKTQIALLKAARKMGF